MAKSQQTFSKKEKEKKRKQKAQDKEFRKQERKNNTVDGNDLTVMMAYVDADGNLVSTPPEPPQKPIKK